MHEDHLVGLRQMMDLQIDLQRQLGVDIEQMSPTELMAFVREQTLACADELHEALQETGWKTWAKNPHVNTEAFRAELIDAWQFLMNLMWVAGMTPEMLYAGHARKVAKNFDRHQANYDGVSTKCPTCRRAYDDDAVKCYEGHCGWNEFVEKTKVVSLQIGTSRS
jgi:hypothetical protein